jgi:hypothetical protein
MADTPNTPQTAEQAAALTKGLGELTTQITNNQQALGSWEQFMSSCAEGLHKIEDVASNAGVSLSNLTDLTDAQTDTIAKLGGAFIKAREAFAGFAGVDYSGLSTLTSQMNNIKEALFSGGTAAADAGKVIEDLIPKLRNMGATEAQINKAKQDGAKGVLDLATNMAAYSDNMARAQTASVQMAARTGELGNLFAEAGDHLQNMDTYLEKQTDMTNLSSHATGIYGDQMEKWYNQLGLIPGGLKQTADGTSMLTATIQAATGAGMSMSETMENMSVAFKDYNLQGEKALLFSVRMADVSTKLHAPIEDVEKALRGSADAFQMFVTGQKGAASSTESLAKTLNEYGAALESTGLSATQAVAVAGDLANRTAKLSTGQLSFISQQTGGAGGLQGAAQETLKLQKDPGAAVEDAMKTLQQQFGKIVTVQEAATSQAAAAQNYKQTQMLQSLIPMAKDTATANRLLEAMKNKADGNPGAIAAALSDHPIQDYAKKGADIESKTIGITTTIMNTVEDIRSIISRGASHIMGGYTAATQRPQLAQTDREHFTQQMQAQLKNALNEDRSAAREAGGIQTDETAEQMKNGLRPSGGRDAATAAHRDLTSVGGAVPPWLKSAFTEMTSVMFSGDNEKMKKEQEVLNEMVQDRKNSVKDLQGNPQAQEQAAAELKGYQALQKTFAQAKDTSARSQLKPYTSPAHTPGTGAPTLTPYHAPGAANANTLHIVGKITIDCPHCGKPHDASNQFKAYTAPAGQSQQ